MKLIKAIKAAADYSAAEENGVEIVAARSADMANRWFVVEGRKKAWRRIYVVDMSSLNGFVAEIVGCSQMADADLIISAIRQRNIEMA